MVFGSSEAKGRTAAAVWSVLVNAIQFPWVFHLILRSGGAPLEVRNALMSWTVVDFVSSGVRGWGGVEDNG